MHCRISRGVKARQLRLSIIRWGRMLVATPLFLVGVDELLRIDGGHALVTIEARAENELLTGLG